MSDRITILAGMVALVALCVMAALERAPAIEHDVRARVQQAVQQPTLNTHVSGRDVTFTGTVASAAEAAAVRGRLEAVPGVRRVSDRAFVANTTNEITRTPSPRVNYNYSLSVRDNGSIVRVNGNVPNDLSRQRIMTIVYTAAIGKEVQAEELSVAGVDSPRASAWDEAARKSLQVAVVLAQLEFDLRDEVLTIGGLAEDEAHRAKIIGDLQQFGGERRFAVNVVMSQTDLCQNEIDELVRKQALIFESDESSLTPESTTTLDLIVGALWQCPSATIQIVDDNNPSSSALSQARLNAVARYLIAQGIVATRLTTQPRANLNTDRPGSKIISISIGPRDP